MKQWKILYKIMAGKTSSFLFKWMFGRAKEESITINSIKEELEQFNREEKHTQKLIMVGKIDDNINFYNYDFLKYDTYFKGIIWLYISNSAEELKSNINILIWEMKQVPKD